jgi:hypothetical protein
MSVALVVMDKQSSSALAQLDKARQLLAEARTLPEVKKIRNIAESAKFYAKAANLGREAQNYAAEISLLAARKAGEILKQLEKTPKQSAASVAGDSEYRKTLKDTGTKERTAQHWQKLAEVPQPTFQKYISNAEERQEDITAAGLLKSVPRPAPATPKPAALSPEKTRAAELQAFVQTLWSTAAIVTVCRKLSGLTPFHFNLEIYELEEEDLRAAMTAASESRKQRVKKALAKRGKS